MDADENTSSPPDALLLIGPGCAHCAAVLQALAEMVKDGSIGRLEVVNVSAHPEAADSRGVRSVPWLRLGRFEFDGALGAAELRRWAQRAASPRGMAEYFLAMLTSGRRDRVEAIIAEYPASSLALVDLLEDPQASMAVRLGIGAVLEQLHGSGLTAPMVPGLGRLARSGDARLRADACHLLSLAGGAETIPYIAACLEDPDAEVREIAAEALAEVGAAKPG